MFPGETVLSGGKHPGTLLEVLESPAGFYLGFRLPSGEHYSRETEYMPKEQAEVMWLLVRRP